MISAALLHAASRAPCANCRDCSVRDKAICSALAETEICALERLVSSRCLESGQTLFEQGDRRQRVYTVTAGVLRVFTSLPDGRRQITGFLMPGDFLGLADQDRHQQTAEAIGPVSLCSFSVEAMDELAGRFPRLKDRRYEMAQAALQRAQDSQLVLGRLAPLEKLASFLVAMSRRIVPRTQPGVPLTLPMPRTDIADHLGLTVETVSRAFTELRKRGLIRLDGPYVVHLARGSDLAELAGQQAC